MLVVIGAVGFERDQFLVDEAADAEADLFDIRGQHEIHDASSLSVMVGGVDAPER